jgi:hypothetical protein
MILITNWNYNGAYYLGDKFQGNMILVQNDSSIITILDQVIWQLAQKLSSLPKKVEAPYIK